MPKVGPLLFPTLLLFLSPVLVWAQSADEAPLEVKLQAIESRLSRVEANSQKILVNQDKIMAELDRIRIWTRRR